MKINFKELEDKTIGELRNIKPWMEGFNEGMDFIMKKLEELKGGKNDESKKL